MVYADCYGSLFLAWAVEVEGLYFLQVPAKFLMVWPVHGLAARAAVSYAVAVGAEF